MPSSKPSKAHVRLYIVAFLCLQQCYAQVDIYLKVPSSNYKVLYVSGELVQGDFAANRFFTALNGGGANYYKLQDAATKQCLTGGQAGAPFSLSPCGTDGWQFNQLFQFYSKYTDSNAATITTSVKSQYYIKAVGPTQAWSCLQASGGSNGDYVRPASCITSGSEEFYVEAVPLTRFGSNFGGANSFFLYAFQSADRVSVLDAMKAAGMKVLRIFITEVGSNAKGTNCNYVADLENDVVGVYNDDILKRIDDLMLEAYNRGIKLIIAMHDRWALGCWDTDAYAKKYTQYIPNINEQCGTISQDVSGWYKDSGAQQEFDNRLKHILTHRNAKFNNRTWGSLGEVVLAFDIQNEGQGYNDWTLPWVPNWWCDRAQAMRPYLLNGVLVSTGGGKTWAASTISQNFECPYIDIVALHTYNTNDLSQLDQCVKTARVNFKKIILEEFGFTGNDPGRDYWLSQVTSTCNKAGVPWLVWAISKPGLKNDYEIWRDDNPTSWNILSSAAWAATKPGGQFVW